jgi:hypothetical protein
MDDEVGRTMAVHRARRFHDDRADEALVFSVAPTKILAFGKGRFSHTHHRF